MSDPAGSLSMDSSGDSKHVEYLQKLEVPTTERMEEIAEKQERNEERYYRDRRREARGMGLDASVRWIEAVKEAQYRHIIQPTPKHPHMNDSDNNTSHFTGDYDRSWGDSEAREHWKRVVRIARRAGGDDEGSPDEDEDGEGLTEEQRAARRQKKQEKMATLKKHAKMLDLQYFLEMVDRESVRTMSPRDALTLTIREVKHRYGSNLRVYHQEWKKADTMENFFYWLDYGEGKQIDLLWCPRDRLDREQVRYLSREERKDYLVRVDIEGRLCWAKNGARIDTSESYRDSIHGIVPIGDTTPAFSLRTTTRERSQIPSSPSGISFSSSSSLSLLNPPDRSSSDQRNPYANEELSQAKGLNKIRQVSAAIVLDSLLRKTVKRNTWIFVADTSFRLYVGIKQSGTFQHSSFLHGGHISAAGLIKIKNGKIKWLSPLSGHYRPPTSNFRSFMRMLKDSGADMSHVSIGKSYAVLIGLEAYTRTRRKIKSIYRSAHPKVVAEHKKREKGRSWSTRKERKFLGKRRDGKEREKAG